MFPMTVSGLFEKNVFIDFLKIVEFSARHCLATDKNSATRRLFF